MRDLNLKEMMTSRESHLIMKALTVDVDYLGDYGTRRNSTIDIISRINSGDTSLINESWQKLTGEFDLDKIKKIIDGIEDERVLNAIVGIIKSEYSRLLKQGKIKAIFRKKEIFVDWNCIAVDTGLEEHIDDFITQWKEIKNVLQKEKEEREKAASIFNIFCGEKDCHESFVPYSPTFLPQDKELNGQKGGLWVENIVEKTISEEQQTTIAQLREKADKLKQSNTLLKKQIKNLKKKDAQILKENKKHLQEIENLKKINSTQEEEITQLRQEITDTFYVPQIEYEMSEEEKEEYAKFFDDAVYEQVFYDDNLQKISELEDKNKELEANMQKIIEEQGQKYVSIDVLIKGLDDIPDTKEKLSLIEKLGIYVLGDTPCAKRILSLAREINRNLKEIQARQGQTNISATQLVMGNGTQNITNANMASRAE